MSVLSNLEPQRVFHFFEEITRIPHGSGNVGQISDYLADFAGERGLRCIQDELKNIIIIKEATPGYEKEPAVILKYFPLRPQGQSSIPSIAPSSSVSKLCPG